MAAQPQTWTMLQGLQTTIQNEVLVSSASPFSLFDTTPDVGNPGQVSDATRFGTNPNGAITNAIYLGVPKDWQMKYPAQCHIIPPKEDGGLSARHALGGKVWLEQDITVRFLFRAGPLDD